MTWRNLLDQPDGEAGRLAAVGARITEICGTSLPNSCFAMFESMSCSYDSSSLPRRTIKLALVFSGSFEESVSESVKTQRLIDHALRSGRPVTMGDHKMIPIGCSFSDNMSGPLGQYVVEMTLECLDRWPEGVEEMSRAGIPIQTIPVISFSDCYNSDVLNSDETDDLVRESIPDDGTLV